MTNKSKEIYRKALPIMEAAFEEIDDNFTTMSFCALLREKGIDERVITNCMHLPFLGKRAYKPDSGNPKSYTKKKPEQSNHMPQSNDSSELFRPNMVSYVRPSTELKLFTDKQLADELESRGYVVLISEVKYRKPNFES